MNDFWGRIIDSHAHIFPHKIALKASESIGKFYGLPMAAVGTIGQLLESGSKIGAARYVVSSTATKREQVRAINGFIAEAAKRYPQFVGLMTLHQDMSPQEIEEEIGFAVKNDFKGIKLHPDFQEVAIDHRKLYNIYCAAQGRLPILIHTGDKRYSYSNPYRLAKVLREFPQLKAIAAHFGGYSEWDSLDCYKGLDNIFFDTCSSLKFLPREKARRIVCAFGAERFLFGTDFPMWSHEEELKLLLNLGLSSKDVECILYKNAEKFYNIG
ncbi:MAG: amidohydrolase family protein [Clostridiales bacterium]|jgi:predicted TIM-barrel fold metal-dependent hydrolase|nr:amidohydrolase family protein [Clostridiales bacterium]